jgi:hypothetical protein
MLFSHLFVRLRRRLSLSLLFPLTVLRAFYLYPDVLYIPLILFLLDSAITIISYEYG